MPDVADFLLEPFLAAWTGIFFTVDFFAVFFREGEAAALLPAFFAVFLDVFLDVFLATFLDGFFTDAAGFAAFFRLVAFFRATAFFFDAFLVEDFFVEAFLVLNLRLLLAVVVPAFFLPMGFFLEADFFLLTPARLLLLAAFFAGISSLLPVEKNAELYIG